MMEPTGGLQPLSATQDGSYDDASRQEDSNKQGRCWSKFSMPNCGIKAKASAAAEKVADFGRACTKNKKRKALLALVVIVAAATIAYFTNADAAQFMDKAGKSIADFTTGTVVPGIVENKEIIGASVGGAALLILSGLGLREHSKYAVRNASKKLRMKTLRNTDMYQLKTNGSVTLTEAGKAEKAAQKAKKPSCFSRFHQPDEIEDLHNDEY
ncbi:hypothetical protein SCG7109_AI_00040 [Chlamydiales bacterium SCGC AG-110-M15]|nr:hypothetical protein SCG7109_AI_00040 [Chlamydiales bacterium SCGC AG-110-M15]